MCKHIVGIAALEKLIKIPCEAKSVEIGQKPSRGRPAQARKALQHQEPVALVQQPMPQASILPCTSSDIPAPTQTKTPIKEPAKRGRKPKPKIISPPKTAPEIATEPISAPPPSLIKAAPSLLLLRASKRKCIESLSAGPAKKGSKQTAQ